MRPMASFSPPDRGAQSGDHRRARGRGAARARPPALRDPCSPATTTRPTTTRSRAWWSPARARPRDRDPRALRRGTPRAHPEAHRAHRADPRCNSWSSRSSSAAGSPRTWTPRPATPPTTGCSTAWKTSSRPQTRPPTQQRRRLAEPLPPASTRPSSTEWLRGAAVRWRSGGVFSGEGSQVDPWSSPSVSSAPRPARQPLPPLHRRRALRKRAAWNRPGPCRTWEDAGAAEDQAPGGKIPECRPPSLTKTTSSRRAFSIRGKLNVPRERFILFAELNPEPIRLERLARPRPRPRPGRGLCLAEKDPQDPLPRPPPSRPAPLRRHAGPLGEPARREALGRRRDPRRADGAGPRGVPSVLPCVRGQRLVTAWQREAQGHARHRRRARAARRAPSQRHGAPRGRSPGGRATLRGHHRGPRLSCADLHRPWVARAARRWPTSVRVGCSQSLLAEGR